MAACCDSSNGGISHLFEPTTTRSPSFPCDRWRGPTVTAEQQSLSQPKPCRVVLIVCSGAVGLAHLIAAITKCLYGDRRGLAWAFRERFVLRRSSGEKTMGRDREARNCGDGSSPSEQIARSPLERSSFSGRGLSARLTLFTARDSRRRDASQNVCARGPRPSACPTDGALTQSVNRWPLGGAAPCINHGIKLSNGRT